MVTVINEYRVEDTRITSAPGAASAISQTMDMGGAIVVNVRVRIQRAVRPLRAEDYPVLAELWSGDDDDDIFTDQPAV